MPRTSRRRALRLAGTGLVGLSGGAVTGLAGCAARGSGPALAELDEWPPPRRGDTLGFWTWQQYWGDQAVAFEHARDLEDVDYEAIPAREQVSRLPDESPDVVHLLPRQFGRARDAGLLQPLPTDVMPAWPPEGPFRAHDLEYYERDGEYHGYPQTPIGMALAYHSGELSEPTSWATLWNESHAGRIAMPSDPVLLGQIAALYTGQDPHDPADPDAVRTALREQRPLVATYWTDWLDAWHRFGRDELAAAVLPQPRLCLCAQDGTPIRYAAPEAGLVYGRCALAVPAGAANPYLAAEFVDWAAQFKTGTETMWGADEWRLHQARPVASGTRETYESIASELDGDGLDT